MSDEQMYFTSFFEYDSIDYKMCKIHCLKLREGVFVCHRCCKHIRPKYYRSQPPPKLISRKKSTEHDTNVVCHVKCRCSRTQHVRFYARFHIDWMRYAPLLLLHIPATYFPRTHCAAEIRLYAHSYAIYFKLHCFAIYRSQRCR